MAGGTILGGPDWSLQLINFGRALVFPARQIKGRRPKPTPAK